MPRDKACWRRATGSSFLARDMSIRCTPFCGPCGKTYKHSDLLVALLNTKDHDKNFFSLSSEIRKLEKGGWNRNDEIPEVNRKYQFPLIHWACVLGKTNAVRWLLDQGWFIHWDDWSIACAMYSSECRACSKVCGERGRGGIEWQYALFYQINCLSIEKMGVLCPLTPSSFTAVNVCAIVCTGNEGFLVANS